MFNLEESIAQWRRQIRDAGIKSSGRLDELETHLRDDIRVLLSAGEDDAAAFASAVSRLGPAGLLGVEFNKIKSGQIWPVKIAAAVWFGSVLLTAAFLARRLASGHLDFLTYTHVVAATAGYSAALVAGGFGLYFVGLARLGFLSPARRQSLKWGVYWSSHVALVLIVVCTVLALFVSRELFGRYWSWDAKETGAFCLIVWFAALAAMLRSQPVSDRAIMLMGIAANIIVGFAWFGANLIYHSATPVYAMVSAWPLDGWIGINLCFLALGLLPDSAQEE